MPSKQESDLRNRCHIATNETGDHFVGIKVDSDSSSVCFPLGYHLPETDWEIRADIRLLIRVLSEFTTEKDRLLAVNSFAQPQAVGFPIHAYRTVIETYLSAGGRYYVETDPSYQTGASGKICWPRTVKKQMPLVQQQNGSVSFIYTGFVTRSAIPNDRKLITQINRYCVYEAFQKLGWMYVPFLPEQPGPHPDIRTSLAVLRKKLGNTNDDRKKRLFQAMADMLQYLEEETSRRRPYFGTDSFEYVWEKLIDRAFGERDKERYFPRARWLLDFGGRREQKPLLPDTIMIYNRKYYVLDAKYYRYGCTGDPSHLPHSSSIHKQITYGEYLERTMSLPDDSLFNAFIMPYNMEENPFGLTGPVGNIGEAVGDWRRNQKYYERVQGIVMDTRYLMLHYTGDLSKVKAVLAECIETVLGRGPV